jgi:hypothetical protein
MQILTILIKILKEAMLIKKEIEIETESITEIKIKLEIEIETEIENKIIIIIIEMKDHITEITILMIILDIATKEKDGLIIDNNSLFF